MVKLSTVQEYNNLLQNLLDLPEVDRTPILRQLLRTDLYFLLFYGLNRPDAARQWILERCQEVQAQPNGYLDLWAREHYKSTIITFAKTIQDILASHGDDPLTEREVTVGIFSFTRPIAKGFLKQIMRELETNQVLLALFPDILWANPKKDAAKWSEDGGIVVKRKGNPKESTVEAWGLVDGQPTSKHFLLKVYDDVVTVDNCRSPEMIAKTTEAWELSDNLGTDGGVERYVGTRYHFNDTYKAIMDRKAAIPRLYPATVDGTVEGEPVLLTREALTEKRLKQGSYTFACQMLQNPIADSAQGFKLDWLKYYDYVNSSDMNIYLLVDSASEKKKTSDYTAMEIVGLGADNNYYTLDLLRDRLNLKERGDALFRLHRKWRPLNVGYEKYGTMADIEYMQERMEREGYRFHITPLGGSIPKPDRIRKLIPSHQEGRWYYPKTMYRRNYEGASIDLIQTFINDEYLPFPVAGHDDMLDVKARIFEEDLQAAFPQFYDDDDDDDYKFIEQGRNSITGY